MKPMVVALVPAFNEATAIARVICGVAPHVDEVLVIDDVSRDETAAVARESGATVISRSGQRGKGLAVRAGIASVLTRSDVGHVLMLDGDMQHLPDEAPRFLEAAASTGADLVIGERQFDPRQMPRSRYYANRCGSAALSSFMGVALRDTQCGYRLFGVDLLRRMSLRATGYDIETEMLIKAGRLGARIVQVPVSSIYTGAGSKLRPVRDTTRTCLRAIFYRYLERT